MKQILLTALRFFVLLVSIVTWAQKPVYPRPNEQKPIPFGQKLPAPEAKNAYPKDKMAQQKKWGSIPYIAYDEKNKVFKPHFGGRLTEEAPDFKPGKRKAEGGGQGNNSTSFRLAKDINVRTESDPSNFQTDVYPSQFALLNNVSYFYADDGIHGRELWRSDGTANGTYLVKDINPGDGSSGRFENHITTINGKLYFTASNGYDGMEPWVSDGTAGGTYQLADINPGSYDSHPNQFVSVNNTIFFVASASFSFNNLLCKTDGTPAGTTLVTNTNNSGGYQIAQSTAANGMLFFTLYSWATGTQLWRSDGSEPGTYQVKQIGNYGHSNSAPMQLTAYNDRLFFSADDGTGRRLWTSDGTEVGTGYSPGANYVLLRTDYIGSYTNIPFTILNNVLYLSGFTYSDGSGLYKYDAATTDGLVLVKDLTPSYENVFITSGDMTIINNKIFFKVISETGGYHDELWSTDGTEVNTKAYKVFEPGTWTYAFVSGYGSLYFGAGHPEYGREFWKSDGTSEGTVMVKDIWPGAVSSAPYYFTPVNGKILMNAADPKKGASLYASDGTEAGTVLLKDINTRTTGSSYAGLDHIGLVPFQDKVIFTAYEREFGRELYISDGTGKGSGLLIDLEPGENSSHIEKLITGNNVFYFIAYTSTGRSLYKSNGTKTGVQKLMNLGYLYIEALTVADNGLLFYTVFDYSSYMYQLWRTDGTPEGTFTLGSNLSYSTNWALAGSTLFYVAGDYTTGYELWKTDGTVAGTGLVKDINPGWESSSPYSLFAYNNQVYFGAFEGHSSYVYSFWKSDGTASGTVKLKDITPAYAYDQASLKSIYAVSNKQVYLSAADYTSLPFIGSELYKTDGTPKGTQLVKDINPVPYVGSFPYNLTDVDGILYFTADDGEHGTELWSTNGTPQKTRLVKDISQGYSSGYYHRLYAAGDKLFFMHQSLGGDAVLWVSDRGHASDPNRDNTFPVDDPVLNSLTNIGNLTPAGNNFFLTGYSYQFGFEVYVADVTSKPYFVNHTAKGAITPVEETDAPFELGVFPNPSRGSTTLTLRGKSSPTTISVTDMTGKVVWQQRVNRAVTVSLPMDLYPAGVYLIQAKNDSGQKTIRLVKE